MDPRTNATIYRSWATDILPLIEQAPIAKAYNTAEDYSSAGNLPVIANSIRVYQCSSSPALNRTAPVYNASGGTTGTMGGAIDYFPHGAINSEDLSAEKPRNPALLVNINQPFTGIKDGLSQTMLLNEVAMRPAWFINGMRQTASVGDPRAAFWGGLARTKLSTYNLDGSVSATPLAAPCAVNCNNNEGIHAFHPAGANSLFCDGSVHFLSKSVSASVVIALATRDGNEVLSSEGY
jgi:prepilin-type processing-associated H-X9-DG protein